MHTERLEALIRDAAKRTSPVIITGEPGSGRTYTARRIHTLSGRTGAFTGLNAADVPQSLCNSELFGCKSAFFPVVDAAPGRCVRAAYGTFCIDEPHLLDERDQRYLIEFAETGRVPNYHGYVGETRYVEDARVVVVLDWFGLAAPCTVLVDALRGRPDVIHIDIPPLRERREEIQPLFTTFLREAASEAGVPPVPVTAEMLTSVVEYSWPGNIAELRTLARSVVASGDGSRVAFRLTSE